MSIECVLDIAMDGQGHTQLRWKRERAAGVVYLVGAGPGDPGLMTARSLELIASADAIFHDRLIPPGALDGARADAELVYVGKAPADVPVVRPIWPSTTARRSQGEINERLIEAARAGKSVVRLKGGDPFVFGRGGEEGEALRAAGVEFEVVPGVTAGVAASAYAGIPVTHRDDASAVAFVTGHEDPEKAETALDWEALARFPGTLVFYMGVKRLGDNAAALIAAGRDADEPAAAVERGTMEGQRTVVATLGTLAEAVEREGDRRPGADRRRPGGRAPRGARLARAPPAARPARRRHPRPCPGQRPRRDPARPRRRGRRAAGDPDRAADRERRGAARGRADRRVRADLRDEPERGAPAVRGAGAAGLDARALGGDETAAGRGGRARRTTGRARSGPGTARALPSMGSPPTSSPSGSSPRRWSRRWPGRGRGPRVLVARAAEARDVLPDALRERGAEVDVVALYETVREEPAPEAVEAAQSADYVTFTSSSTVRNLTEALGDRFPAEARIVSIGPITSEAARDAGLEVHVEAERHDVDGLVEALLADATG